MKRLLLIFAILATLGLPALAQVHGNVIVSPALNVGPAMRAGADLDIRLSGKYYLMPGIYWAHRSLDEDSEIKINGDVTRKEYTHRADFIEVPIRVAIGFQYPQRQLETRLYMGPYVAYGIGGHTTYTVNKNGEETSDRYSAFGDNGGWHHRWDAGLQLGFDAYLRGHWALGVYISDGFTKNHVVHSTVMDVVSDIFLGIGKRNFAVGLNLGYRF